MKKQQRDSRRRPLFERVMAMMLALTMILGSGGVQALAEEVHISAQEQSADAAPTPETKAPETSAPETPAPETQAPETPAPETQAPETSAPETQAPETQAPETQAPETQTPETEAPETSAPESQEPNATESEMIAGTEDLGTESEQTEEAVTEPKTEEEPEEETEKAELSVFVAQEAFVETDGELSVKYTVTINNQTANTKATDIAVKAVLSKNASYYGREGQTNGAAWIEDIWRIPQGLDLDELSAYTAEQTMPFASAVIWPNETIDGGAKKEYVFFARAEKEAQSAYDLPALFFVDGERVNDNKIAWYNAETIAAVRAAEKEAETENSGAQRQIVTKIKVTGDVVNLRSGAGTDFELVATVERDTELSVQGQETDAEGYIWYLVSFNGQLCYIRGDFAEVTETKEAFTEESDSPAMMMAAPALRTGDVTFTDEDTNVKVRVPAGSLLLDETPVTKDEDIKAAITITPIALDDTQNTWLEGYHHYIGFTLGGGGTQQFYAVTFADGIEIAEDAGITLTMPNPGALEGTLITWAISEDDGRPVNNSWGIDQDTIRITGSGVYGITNALERKDINIDADSSLVAEDDTVTIKFVWQHGYGDAADWQWQYSTDYSSWQPIAGGTDGYTITGSVADGDLTLSYTFAADMSGYHYRLAALDQDGALIAPSDVVSIYNKDDTNVNVDWSNPKEVAEYYYGENAVKPISVGTVSLTPGSEMTVYAGETKGFTVSYSLSGAAKVSYGTSGVLGLFDTYDNTKIHFTLPEGLSIQPMEGMTEATDPDTGATTYTFALNPSISATNGSNGSFQITVSVDGNGKVAAGTSYVINLEDALCLDTSFAILDKSQSDSGIITNTGVEYEKHLTAVNQTVTMTTDTTDVWGIRKSNTTTAGVTAEAPKRITKDGQDYIQVQYVLEVGLKSGSDIATANNALYQGAGRVPFESFALKETPQVLDRDGQKVAASKITITPQFGDKAEIEVNADTPNTNIPINTMAGANLSGTKVDGNAPYYSTYLVTMLYEPEAFVAEWNEEEQGKLTIENTAELTYKFANREAVTVNGSASTAYGEITSPAALSISKYITADETDVTGTLYSRANQAALSPVSGAAEFAVYEIPEGMTEEAAEALTSYESLTAAKLYYRSTPNTYYEAYASNLITIDPESTANEGLTANDGTAEFYAAPGRYLVVETQYPANTKEITGQKAITAKAGSNPAVQMYNQELLGSVTIDKRAAQPGVAFRDAAALAGAKFELQKKESDTWTTAVSGTTNNNGGLTFNRLAYGAYRLVETAAPNADYIGAEAVEFSIPYSGNEETIKASGANYENIKVNILNTLNRASLTLQKQYYSSDGKYVNINSGTIAQEFSGAFELQYRKKTDSAGEEWAMYKDASGKEVTKISLTATGQASFTGLPVYAEDGVSLYEYRIKETLPSNWTAVGETTENGARVAYSQAVTLIGSDGAVPNGGNGPVITMQNTRAGDMTLTKTFYGINQSNTFAAVSGKKAQFTLYRRLSGTETIAKLGETYTTDGKGQIKVSDLERFVIDGTEKQVYEYFWVEEETADNEGFQWIGPDNLLAEQTTTDGKNVKAYGPIRLDGDNAWSQSFTFTNVEQKAPVRVIKRQFFKNQWDSELTGTAFAIYDVTDVEELDPETFQPETEPAATGTFMSDRPFDFQLTPGRTYLIRETVCPDGYNTEKPVGTKVSLTNSGDGWAVFKTPETMTSTSGLQTITLKNRPNPKVQVNKQRHYYQTSNHTWVYSDNLREGAVTFDIYKDENGQKVPFEVADGETRIASGTSYRMPEGVYYLHEVIPEGNPDNLLDPDKHPDNYEAKDDEAGITSGWVRKWDGVYYKITVMERASDGTNSFTAVNHTNEGALELTKKDDAARPMLLAGAEFELYQKDADDLPIADTIRTGTTDANGKLRFEPLAIYDENGYKIKYYLKETKAPDEHYIEDPDKEIEVELVDHSITDSKQNQDLTIINKCNNTFLVTKTYQDIWEFNFTNMEYRMSEIKVALYQWVDSGTDLNGKPVSDCYVYTGTLEQTDIMGTILFEDLKAGEYAAIECEVPGWYAYIEPANGKELLGDPREHLTITKKELEDYNYAIKPANPADPNQKGFLSNEKHWAQIHITKWSYNEDADSTAAGPNANNSHRVNYAEFELYRQDVSGQAEDAALDFNAAKAAGEVTLVGTYSTGTLYNTEGTRLNGEFATDILAADDDIVYWLVETSAGSGHVIKADQQYILFRRQGTGFTNRTDNKGIACTRVEDYVNDARTDAAVENTLHEGGGEAMYASVRIAKWGQRYDAFGGMVEEYHPLGNAVFELWLVDEDGNQLLQLDTLTTGLDNDLTTNGEEDDEALSSWAASKTFSYTTLVEKARAVIAAELGEDWPAVKADRDPAVVERVDAEIMRRGIFSELELDESNNNYPFARVGIKEVSAPLKYLNDDTMRYMKMTFYKAGTGSDTTEMFNDAYYVTDAAFNAGYQRAVDQPTGEITWAQYAINKTKEITIGTPVIDQYRLINWPVNNFPVQVHKYGYTPDRNNLGMDSEALDQYYETHTGRTALSGARFRLLKRDVDNTKFVPYDYINNVPVGEATEDGKTGTEENSFFTTGAAGLFLFPAGLTSGWYQIVETGAADGYENIYNLGDAYQSRARYFNVGNSGEDILTISMYNPSCLTLRLLKTDLNRQGIEEQEDKISFTLTNVGTNETYVGSIDDQGHAVIDGIPTGSYYLSETVVNGVPYSAAYLKGYIETKYPELAGLADPNKGLRLGYNVALYPLISAESQTASDTIVYAILDFSYYLNGGTEDGLANKGEDGAVIEVPNPPTVSLTLKKIREQTTNAASETGLANAKFDVYYMPFTKVNEETSVSKLPAATTGAGLNGWTYLQEAVTDANGTVTLSGKDPGIFYVKEKQAPANYEELPKQTGKLIVLDGGMKVTVDAAATGLTTEKPDDGEEQTAYTAVFANRYTVPLTVQKEIDMGDLGGNAPAFRVTVNLYDSETAQKPIDSVTLANSSAAQTFTKRLSKEKTYYLEEVTEGGQLAFAKIEQYGSNTEDVTLSDIRTANGRFAVTADVDREADIQVRFTNKYLHARATILKAAVNSGFGLAGAEFEIKKVVTEGSASVEKNVAGAVWTESADHPGMYTVEIPMDSDEEAVYRIYETKAPQYHVGLERPIELRLEPGAVYTYNAQMENRPLENKIDEALVNGIMPNQNGFEIVVTKYDNVSGAQGAARKPLEGAVFDLYYKNSVSGNQWQVRTAGAATDENGQVRFTLVNGTAYALAEREMTGYAGLESVHDDAGGELVTEELNGATLYLLNGGKENWPLTSSAAGQTFSFDAYNSPYVDLVIEKTTDTGAVQTVDAAVYELENSLIQPDMSAEDILALAKADGRRLGGGTHTYRTTAGSGKSSISISNTAQGGYTYVVEEVQIVTGGTSVNKSDRDVTWLGYVTVPVGETKSQTVALKNVNASVSSSLKKTVDKGKIASLFDEGDTLTYTITPSVGANTYALDGFTVTDAGLTALHKDAAGTYQELDAAYLKDKYRFTEVEVEASSHDASMFGAQGAEIYAAVTFYDSDGRELSKTPAQSVSGQSAVFNAPAGAAGFAVSYYAPALQGATEAIAELKGTGYALGKNFVPGAIKATAEIDRQAGGRITADGKEQLVQSIDRITNSVQSEALYRRWNKGGEIQQGPALTKTASANTEVETFKAPTMTITKTAEADQMELDATMMYTITVTNTDLEGSGKAIKQLRVVDLLPFGAALDTTKAGGVEIIDAGSSQMYIDGSVALQTVGSGALASTAVIVNLNNADGSGLQAKDSVSIALYMKAEKSVTSYEPQMYNYAFAASLEPGVMYEKNERGISYKNDMGESAGDWAAELKSLTSDAMAGLSQERLQALAEGLEKLGSAYANAGYIGAFDDVTWRGIGGVAIQKSNYGSLDEPMFSSTRVARTQYEDEKDEKGWVMYRLSVNRIATSTADIGNLALIDVLPAVNDIELVTGAQRYSRWPLDFEKITSVTVGNQTLSSSDYTVLYYTGDAKALTEDGTRTMLADYRKDNLLAKGWTDNKPAAGITAFAVVINDRYRLDADNMNMAVEYRTVVREMADSKNIEYELAINSFEFMGTEFTGGASAGVDYTQLVDSNTVSVMMAPSPVEVGGNVWIDANGNNVQDPGEVLSENGSAYGNYEIVKALLSGISVTLNKYDNKSKDTSVSTTESYPKGADWNGEFRFADLIAAIPTSDAQGPDKYPVLYPGNALDPSKLYGSNPSTYILDVTYPSSLGFGLAEVGATSYISHDPTSLGSDNPASTDMNFTGGNGTAKSERFYLWPTSEGDTTDMSKDIGFTLTRDLTVKKVAESNSAPVAGATFAAYGPLNDGGTLPADLKLAAEATTGADGTAALTGLNFFQKYLIVETGVPAGYKQGTAKVVGNGVDTGTGFAEYTGVLTGELTGKNAWILDIPNTDSAEVRETVTISNERQEAEFSLEVTKVLENKALTAGAFRFELKDSAGTVIDTKTNGVPGAGGEAVVTFDKISVKMPGTYTYTIKERIHDAAVNNKYQGITYDTGTITAKVAVTWQEDKGLVAGTPQYTYSGPNSPDTARFTNTYRAEGTWTPEGTKTLNGRDMKTGQTPETFAFSVKEGGKVVSTGTASRGKNGEPADITFTPVTYTLDDVREQHTYVITEDGTDGNGLTLDKASYTATVTVEDNGDGTLRVEASYQKDGQPAENAQKADFVNEYRPQPAKYQPKVQKTLTGSALPQDMAGHTAAFAFTLEADPDNPNGAELPQNSEIQITVTKENDNPAIGTGLFGAITFSKTGDYRFTVKEKAMNQKGFTYDETRWTLSLTVADDQNGNLYVVTNGLNGIRYTGNTDPVQTSVSQAEFGNSYKPEETAKALEVFKKMSEDSGILPSGRQFEFELKASTDYPETQVVMPAADPGTRKITTGVTLSSTVKEGTGTFDAITFKEAGTYRFEISEIEEAANNLQFDKTVWKVTVTVADQNGQLTVTETKYEAGGETKTRAEFTNTYKPTSAKFTPKVRKIMEADSAALPASREFTFSLTPTAGFSSDEVEMTGTQTSVTLDGQKTSGEASFGEITFKTAGIYKFEVKEVVEDQADGYTYDSRIWTLEVNVTDKGGRLEAQGTYYINNPSQGTSIAEFRNRYTTTDTAYAPQVSKTITGAGRPQEQTFCFTLTADPGNPNGAEMPDNTTAEVTGAGTGAFDAINFKKAGIYSFLINETDEGLPGYDYDAAQWTVVVTVTDEKSHLKASAEYRKNGTAVSGAAEAAFVNNYTTTPASAEVKVDKTISGSVISADTPFTFTLTPVGNYGDKVYTMNGQDQIPVTSLTAGITVLKEQTAGSGQFAAMYFKEAGNYSFRVREEKPTANGFAENTSIQNVEISVTDKDGALRAKVTYPDGDGAAASAKFVNLYNTEDTSYTPTAAKTISDESAPLAKDTAFEFTLTADHPSDGAVVNNIPLTSMKKELTVPKGGKNAGGSFDTITFKKKGTYTFTIAETDTKLAGYTYSQAQWKLTVVVADVGGKLEVDNTQTGYTRVADDDGTTDKTAGTTAAFVNDYHTTEGGYAPRVAKTVVGDDRPEVAGQTDKKEFTFTLAARAGNPAGAQITGTAEAKAKEGETVLFGNIAFSEEGTFFFDITESGSYPGYTNETDTWAVKVVVTDVDSQLKPAVTYLKNGAEDADATKAGAAAFENTYEVGEVSYTPVVEKVITGADTPENNTKTFTFTLANAANASNNGAALSTATASVGGAGLSTAPGNTGFGPIKFEKAGAYVFTITEDDGGADGYTYDTTPWNLTVNVKDAGGKLEIDSVTYERTVNGQPQTSEGKLADNTVGQAKATVTNTYTVTETDYTPSVRKTLTGVNPPDTKRFWFKLEATERPQGTGIDPEGRVNPQGGAILTGADAEGADKKYLDMTEVGTAKSDTVSFDKIRFTKTGEYWFRITEDDAGETHGWDYDDAVWNLKVVVTDTESKLEAKATYYKN